jgi:hypothetical protein
VLILPWSAHEIGWEKKLVNLDVNHRKVKDPRLTTRPRSSQLAGSAKTSGASLDESKRDEQAMQ